MLLLHLAQMGGDVPCRLQDAMHITCLFALYLPVGNLLRRIVGNGGR